MRELIIDIETWPVPKADMEAFIPSVEPFDPATVKVGNLKDASKIEAKIAAAETDHYAAQAVKVDEAVSRATLSSARSRVYATILTDGEGTRVYQHCDPTEEQERELLGRLWLAIIDSDVVVGHNLLRFDLPYIFGRSIQLGMNKPFNLGDMPRYSGMDVAMHVVGGFKRVKFRDTCAEFKPLDTAGEGCSLNACARWAGLEAKVDLDDRLPWQVAQEDPEKALRYAERDGDLTWQLYNKIK